MFYLPLSLFNFISLLNFFYSLLHNFIIFPPQCFYSLLHNFYYFPSSMFFIPLLHLHLLIYSIYFSHPQIHRPPINPTSTPHPPYIDPSSTLHRPYIDPTSTPLRPYIDPTSTLHSTFFNTASWIVKLYTTTATTFLLFTLHHHHHQLWQVQTFLKKKTPGKDIIASLRCHGYSDCNKSQIIRNFHLYVI